MVVFAYKRFQFPSTTHLGSQFPIHIHFLQRSLLAPWPPSIGHMAFRALRPKKPLVMDSIHPTNIINPPSTQKSTSPTTGNKKRRSRFGRLLSFNKELNMDKAVAAQNGADQHQQATDATSTTTNTKEDWPIAIGFAHHPDVPTPTALKITGEIPDYVKGTLYRIGPAGHELKCDNGKTFNVDHWFDGFTQIHRFQIISPTTILYNSRHTCDALVEKIRREGSFGDAYTFGNGRDPCKSVFNKFVSLFRPGPAVDDPSIENVGVTVSKDMPGLPSTDPTEPPGKNLWAKTDSAMYQQLNPETLEPIGVARQSAHHPDLNGQLTAAHSRTDPETGDVFNFNLAIGRTVVYRVFKISKETGKTTILATINGASAAYIHSFFLTKNHVILCVWNSHFSYNGMSIPWNRNILDSIAPFDASKNAMWYVVDRSPTARGLVAVFESPAFYAFHTTNSWEVPGRDEGATDVVCEVAALENLDILHKLLYANLLSKSPTAHTWRKTGAARLARYVLRGVPNTGTLPQYSPRKAELAWQASRELNMELPTVNGNYLMQPNRYTYGLATNGSSPLMEMLLKYDSETHTAKTWVCEGHTPGEAVFVARPGAEEEDDGVVLSVVLDGRGGRSYLLVLDARTMEEVGRADVGSVVGLGFHGRFVGDEGLGVEGSRWAEW